MPEAGKKHKSYKRPPIIEAVIEVRFANSLDDKKLEKLVSKQKSKFTIQTLQKVEFRIPLNEEAGVTAEAKTEFAGYKLINNVDSSIIVQIKRDAISFSKLPPYEGWPKLVTEFKKFYDWYTNKNFKSLSRIGIRYINRIDIPAAGQNIELEDYLKIYPQVPKKKFPVFNSYSTQIVSDIECDRVLTVNVRGADEPPLLNFESIIFDIDIAQSKNLPNNNPQLFKVLEEIRNKKNFFFEDLLTPKCKRLFN